MHIRLLAFGIAKDILGERSRIWEIVPGSTVADLKFALNTEFADFARLRSLRCAVNEEYVDDTHQLNEDDEVVLIPPVSGG